MSTSKPTNNTKMVLEEHPFHSFKMIPHTLEKVTLSDMRMHHESMRSRKRRNRLQMILQKPEIPRMEWYMWKDSDGYLMRVPVRERMRMICMRTEIR